MKAGEGLIYGGFAIAAGAIFWYWDKFPSFTSPASAEPQAVEKIALYQEQKKWLQRGDLVGDSEVVAGLGFVTIQPAQGEVFAPFNGKAIAGEHDCVLFTTPDLPRYKFQLCNLKSPTLGDLAQGQSLGKVNVLQIATLRDNQDKTWAMVEPLEIVLEKLLGTSSVSQGTKSGMLPPQRSRS